MIGVKGFGELLALLGDVLVTVLLVIILGSPSLRLVFCETMF